MSTLRQDVWFGENPRLGGLRLGPFRGAQARMVLHPHRAAPNANPNLLDFVECAAERVEVVLLHPRSAEGASALVAQWQGDFLRVIECIGRTWNDGLPLVLGGFGLGGALALAPAGHAGVRAVVALAPFVPPQTPWPAAAGGEASFDPSALDRPVLVVAPRDEPRLDRARLEAAVARWPQATWMGPPGGAAVTLSALWARVVAEWVVAVTRT